MSKRKKIPPKIKITHILYKFYKIEVYHNKTEEEIPYDGDFFPEDTDDIKKDKILGKYDPDDIQFEIEECKGDFSIIQKSWESTIDVKRILPILEKIVQEHGSQYDKIEIVISGCEQAYEPGYPRIIGIRDETDEEYRIRLENLRNEEKAKQKKKEEQKKAREEKKRQQEISTLKKLQMKYNKKSVANN